MRYELLRTSLQSRVLKFFFSFLLYAVGFFAFVWLTAFYWNTPRERVLIERQHYLESKYTVINKKLSFIETKLQELEKRDNEVYRSIFEVAPISTSNRAKQFHAQDSFLASLDADELTSSIKQQIEQISNRIAYQEKSLKQIAKKASNKEKLLHATPAIQPISNKQLNRLSSGYGYRLDPVYKVMKRHNGVDFSAPSGTPIYATADGRVAYSGYKYNGYGKHVIINHGYGYKTLYAHMKRIKAKYRQRVKRGEIIGWVGSTGKSTAPHLHYEVIRNNRKINPIYFFYSDLNGEQFDQLLQQAQLNNQSFD